ncbi:MAG: hypothetical protein OES46_15320 [Gammaproteobacteria bacterium]|nr:hypothetical protein [Gammaproteobacteria bacterium]
MKRQLIIVAAAMYAALAGPTGVQAGLTGVHAVDSWFDLGKPTEIVVELGTKSGNLVIIPSTLRLQAYKRYTLIIRNPSDVSHTLSLSEFGATLTHSSTPTYPSQVDEIDVEPGKTVEWFVVPTRVGNYPMRCSNRTHAGAGMVGRIIVK